MLKLEWTEKNGRWIPIPPYTEIKQNSLKNKAIKILEENMEG